MLGEIFADSRMKDRAEFQCIAQVQALLEYDLLAKAQISEGFSFEHPTKVVGVTNDPLRIGNNENPAVDFILLVGNCWTQEAYGIR